MGGAFFLVKLLVKWSLPNPYTAIEDKPSHNARRFPCTDRSYPKMCFNCQVIKQSEVYFNSDLIWNLWLLHFQKKIDSYKQSTVAFWKQSID